MFHYTVNCFPLQSLKRFFKRLNYRSVNVVGHCIYIQPMDQRLELASDLEF